MTAATTTRPAPPPLEHPLPPCSICGETTEYDGGFYCTPCGTSWDSELSHLDGHSSWGDPVLPQCPATIRPWLGHPRYPLLSETTYRCLRSEDHKGLHHGQDSSIGDMHEWGPDDVDGCYVRDIEAVR